jgi:hypothetical protein
MAVTPFQEGDGPHRVIAKFVVRDSGQAEAFGLSWFLDDDREFEWELRAPYPLFDVEDEVAVRLSEEEGHKRFVVTAGGRELFPGMPFVVQADGALLLKWAGREQGRGTLSCVFNGRGDLDVSEYGEFASLPPLGLGDTFSVRVADWQVAE